MRPLQFPPNMSFILTQLLTKYDKVMVLKLFVDADDNELTNKYYNAAFAHNTKIQQSVNRIDTHIDAGFDLFAPGAINNTPSSTSYTVFSNQTDQLRFYVNGSNPINKLDLKVICSAQMYTDTGKCYNTGYYLHPRSSISKTPLRLANSTGIVDSGYRGHLIAMLDVVNSPTNEYYGKKYDRYIQICAPGLVPILVELVNTIEELGEETERGDGGIGSTGR